MAVTWGCCGGGHKDTEAWISGRRQSEVPAGGSHHGTVQASKCGDASWSGHCWGTSKYSYRAMYLYILSPLPTIICLQVMIVLELMAHGDMKQYLEQKRPM